jgi:hypothetical protein
MVRYDAASLVVKVAVNIGRHARQLSDKIHGVFIDKLREETIFYSDKITLSIDRITTGTRSVDLNFYLISSY